MIAYGAGPGRDEIELTLFGPGYGEAIAIHVGDGSWLLIDSCIDPNSKKPAAETYLQAIGVDSTAVRSIVASHWHDDHVGGFGKLARAYPSAEIQMSSVFSNIQASAFLAAFSDAVAGRLTRGTRELYDAVSQREVVFHVHQRSTILELPLSMAPRVVRAVAISPVPAVVSESISRMASYIPRSLEEPINKAPEFKPNMEAVAIHIDWGDCSILLGSDLEDHSEYGWSAILSDTWCRSRRAAQVYKVAHHGSKSGEHADIWTKLLMKEPLACLTPFNNGRQKLPTDADRTRVRSRTSQAYISSGATRKPTMESEKLKRLGDMVSNLSITNAGFGATRIRKRFSDLDWRVELFGAAQRL